MQKQDGVKLKGSVRLEARDAAGALLEERLAENLIVTTGVSWIIGALSGDTAAPTTMKYMALGTGDTAADPADTTLEAPVEARVAGAQSRVTTDVTGDTYQAVASFTMTAPRAVAEAGLFSASTSGTLGARLVFAVMNIPLSGTLQITWQWQLAAS